MSARVRRACPPRFACGNSPPSATATSPSMCWEKGAEIGAHILAGAVLEPRALSELLPDEWQSAPFDSPAEDDQFWLLTEKGKWRLPAPPQMHNRGNFIVSLGKIVRWMGEKAEALGADIFPGFPAAEPVFSEDGKMTGVPDSRPGRGQGRKARAKLCARRGIARQDDHSGGGMPRVGFRGNHSQIQLARGKISPNLRHWLEGVVGGSRGAVARRNGAAHRRLADGFQNLRRVVSVSSRRRENCGGLCGGAGLCQSALVAARRIPAL